MTPAPRLSADDRRAQIVEAVTPAVLEHGAAITTRQLAEAAGVAEGTLFKAFGDKESLLLALAQHHLTVGGLAGEREGAAAAPELDTLEEVVTWTARVLVDRMRFVFRLVMALGPIGQRAAHEAHDDFEASKHRLAERFEPFRDELRVSPVVAAELVRTLAWAAASGWGDAQPASSVDDIIQVLLHGIAATDAATRAAASAPRTATPASALETQKA
ncbi:TetR/AcrR family transcriptional regulator [Agrococcus carbonis]|uniref:TetR/AcrR family transcriptional regulator n=1 Tax=Agrococcus carbonis TaxID=684552 RepID=UPI001E53CDE7|nr:TetR/AcrR family transcriptional regulator [Agrococcus carbonis]